MQGPLPRSTAVNSLMSCFKNYQISKLSHSNLLKLHQRQEWRHLMFHTKFPMSLSKHKGMALDFVSSIGGKIQQNVVLRVVNETRIAIKLFLNL